MLSRFDQDWLDREFGGGAEQQTPQVPSDEQSQYDRDWLDREFGAGASDHLKGPSDVSAETQAVGIAPPTFWKPRDIEATLNREYKAAREDAWAEILREIQAEQRREYLSALKEPPTSRAQQADMSEANHKTQLSSNLDTAQQQAQPDELNANPELNTWRNWFQRQYGTTPEAAERQRREQAQQQRWEGMNVWGERQHLAEELRRKKWEAILGVDSPFIGPDPRAENPELATYWDWERRRGPLIQERERAQMENPEIRKRENRPQVPEWWKVERDMAQMQRQKDYLETTYRVRLGENFDVKSTNDVTDVLDRYAHVVGGKERLNQLLYDGLQYKRPGTRSLSLTRSDSDDSGTSGWFPSETTINFNPKAYQIPNGYPDLIRQGALFDRGNVLENREINTPKWILAHEIGHVMADALREEGVDVDQLYKDTFHGQKTPLHNMSDVDQDTATAIGLAVLMETGMWSPGPNVYTRQIHDYLNNKIMPALRNGPRDTTYPSFPFSGPD